MPLKTDQLKKLSNAQHMIREKQKESATGIYFERQRNEMKSKRGQSRAWLENIGIKAEKAQQRGNTRGPI